MLPRPGGFAVGAEPIRRPGETPPPGRGVFEEREGAGGRNARDRCANVVGLAVRESLPVSQSVALVTIPTAILLVHPSGSNRFHS